MSKPGRPRLKPLPETPAVSKAVTQPLPPLDIVLQPNEEDEDMDEIPGKIKSSKPTLLTSTATNSSHTQNYNNIILIKNEQIVSNTSSLKSKLAETLRQQQHHLLGESDRMSKEKQKFFRFSAFNSERRSKQPAGEPIDKYKFVSSSSDSEPICDKSSLLSRKKSNNNNTLLSNKNNLVGSRKGGKLRKSSDSSCCSSDDDSSGSSSSDSSSSSDDSKSNSSNSSSSFTSGGHTVKKFEELNKAETLINTKNVFAYINSRELNSNVQLPVLNKSYCWTSLPFLQMNSGSATPFQNPTSSFQGSFGQPSSQKLESDVWGFAAEAKKPLNIFTASDSENRQNHSQTDDSDCDVPLSQRRKRHKAHKNRQRHKATVPARYNNSEFFKSTRKTTLLKNNMIMSSDDEAQLSPSKMVQKAINYKKYDLNTLTEKATEKTEEVTAAPTKLQPPYNTLNQSDMGKEPLSCT